MEKRIEIFSTPPLPINGQKECEICVGSNETFFLTGRCHKGVPLRAILENVEEDGRPVSILTLYCYVPTCGRIVAKLKVAEFMKTVTEIKADNIQPLAPIKGKMFTVR